MTGGTGNLGRWGCEQVREQAAELGLEVLGGAERGACLAHLDECAPCRRLVEDMAEVGDNLLTLTPEAEPPPGFELHVLARWAGVRGHQPKRWQKAPTLVAAVAALAALAGVGIGWSTLGHQGVSPAVLQGPGRHLLGATLMGNRGGVGRVFLYTGRPAWVFMTVDTGGHAGIFTCELLVKGKAPVMVGTFHVSAGYGSWGSPITVNPALVQGVRLVDARGEAEAVAAL